MVENKNNILIAFMIILVFIVLGLLGYIVYDKVILDDNDTNISNVDKGNNVELSADELYANYLKKLKNNLNEVYKEYDAEVSIDSNSYVWDKGYNFTITKDGRLLMTLLPEEYEEKYNNYELSKNVLQMFLVETGNGGYKTLYFIKEDGSLNSFCIECISNDKFEIKKEKYKNIVNVVETLFDLTYSGAYGPVFIDIKGNTYVN